MPTVAWPHDVEIHWDAEGQGPVLLIMHQLLRSYPRVYAALLDELAHDRMAVL